MSDLIFEKAEIKEYEFSTFSLRKEKDIFLIDDEVIDENSFIDGVYDYKGNKELTYDLFKKISEH